MESSKFLKATLHSKIPLPSHLSDIPSQNLFQDTEVGEWFFVMLIIDFLFCLRSLLCIEVHGPWSQDPKTTFPKGNQLCDLKVIDWHWRTFLNQLVSLWCLSNPIGFYWQSGDQISGLVILKGIYSTCSEMLKQRFIFSLVKSQSGLCGLEETNSIAKKQQTSRHRKFRGQSGWSPENCF